MKGTAQFMKGIDERKPHVNPSLPVPHNDGTYVKDLCRAYNITPPPDHTKATETSPEIDPMIKEAAAFLIEAGSASTAMLVKQFEISKTRAKEIMSILEADGIVGPPNGTQPRTVTAPPADKNDVLTFEVK